MKLKNKKIALDDLFCFGWPLPWTWNLGVIAWASLEPGADQQPSGPALDRAQPILHGPSPIHTLIHIGL